MEKLLKKMKKAYNIGILGGTFDPVHIGHIKMAEAAYAECMLDRLFFMPTGNPPHKSGITPADKRMEMLRLALSDYPQFEISDIELNRDGIIYTADTIDILKKQWPDAGIYYIIGADSLAYIDKWYHPERFLDKVMLTVCNRDDHDTIELMEMCAKISHEYHSHVIQIPFECIDISSCSIRNNPDKFIEYIPQKVYEFIKKEGLYI